MGSTSASAQGRIHGVPVIDLFAGAGGLGVGASMAGADVRLSVELDPVACETLRANPAFHGRVLEADVTTLTGKGLRRTAGLSKADPLVIVGGAPCQPFSKAAYWTEAGDDAAWRRARARGEAQARPPRPQHIRPDERRDLVAEFWRLIEEAGADGFVFENVPSITHPRNRPVLDNFVNRALAAGYIVCEMRRNAVEFGVAQTRERVFVLGSRGKAPHIPELTHHMPGERAANLSAPITAGEALQGRGTEPEPEEIVTGRWARHLQEVRPGWNYKHHTAWAGHPEPTWETETRFWNFLLKLAPERPSWTIAANPGPWTGPFHWDSRRLRTDEMAALQGFPPGYRIAGNRRQRVRQMGNAVPAPMAHRMTEAVLRSLGAQ